MGGITLKINKDFIKSSIEQDIDHYLEATLDIGLWASEEYVFNKYLNFTDHILDIGCGTGRTTFALYEKGYSNITGVDLSPKMIEKAKFLSDKKQRNIKFIEGDATDLAFSDESFSSILFSFNGFMQIPSTPLRLKTLKEIYRILKKDGYFIFTTHDRYYDEEY